MASMLTKRGHAKLLAEFNELSHKERPRMVNQVATAAAEGDRSENAEYIYSKKRLREIDRRLQYLSRLLKNPQVVSKAMVKTDVVNFGCKVTIEDEEGVRKTWTIVGDGESDFKERTISCSAPVAKGLLGKKVGDMAEVLLESGEVGLEVIAIEVGEID
jgi:transcription elongation factor GreB